MAGIENDQINQDSPPLSKAAATSAPATGQGRGAFYPKVINGIVEAFYKDSSNNEVQLTENGSVKGGGVSGSSFQFFVDSGAPSTQGSNGDIYINSQNGDYYRKEVGDWDLKGNLKGADGQDGTNGTNGLDGANGTIIYFDTVAPDDQDGFDGDVHIKTTAPQEFYEKVSGSWQLRFTVQGGSSSFAYLFGAGAPTTQGNNLDVYQNTQNGDVYKKIDGDWVLQGNVQGAQGPAGADGNDGIDGTTVRTGNGDPDDQLGNDDDLYWRRDSPQRLFKKIGGSWVLQFEVSGGGASLVAEELVIQLGAGATVADKVNAAPQNGIPAGVNVVRGDDALVASSLSGTNADLVFIHNKNKLTVHAALLFLGTFPGNHYASGNLFNASDVKSNETGTQVLLKNAVTTIGNGPSFYRLMLVPILS